MTRGDGLHLLTVVGSANFNQEGTAVEWHPMLSDAEADVEQDWMEFGLRVAWYFYDENYWGEGALANASYYL